MKDSKNKKRQPMDYYMWFLIGIVWLIIGLPMGISSNNWGIFAIGLVFTILGLSHKKQWKDCKRPAWDNLTRKQKQIKIAILIFVFLIAVALGIYIALKWQGVY